MILAKILNVLKFFTPHPILDYYAFRVWRSNYFDRRFYQGVSQGLNILYRSFPARHYVRMGEHLGWQPNPDFSPIAYKRLNPDLEQSNVRPLLHYIRFGAKERRPTKDMVLGIAADQIDTPDIRSLAAQAPKAKAPFAIHLHLYYFEMWATFADRLAALDIAFDLYVTLTRFGDRSEALKNDILAAFPGAMVIFMPNHGRDIFPFVHLVNAGLFAPYEAICKLHSKKSPHRQDGDLWRDHLVSGLLLGSQTKAYLDAFLAEETASLWVADGQHYDDPVWWGSNFKATDSMLRRVEIISQQDRLSFPAGSMYWLKPQLVETIRGLSLSEFDFEPELGQVDGTCAHAFERALGYMAEDGGHRIMQTSELELGKAPPKRKKPRFVSAFYLPQFHTTPENDAWWGKGYTEWTATAAAKPNFEGHHQPQLPTDLGFYDLRQTDVMGAQAKLAQDAGIDAFCAYFYWFDGRRILETPIDRLLDRPDINFPFYLCWANESWRRNWDGLSGDVLLDQPYAPGFEQKLARDTARYMRDHRYQRPDGFRPRFVIYRPEDMPDPEQSLLALRGAWRQEGIGDVELGAVLFHVEGERPFDTKLVDFWMEMPPHNLVTPNDYLIGAPESTDIGLKPQPGFSGLIYNYRNVIANSCDPDYLSKLPTHTISGIMPSWDNTARRGRAAHVAWGANPMTFSAWLRNISQSRLSSSHREEIIINAWNEWAENAALEPSKQYGQSKTSSLKRWLS